MKTQHKDNMVSTHSSISILLLLLLILLCGCLLGAVSNSFDEGRQIESLQRENETMKETINQLSQQILTLTPQQQTLPATVSE